MSSFNKSTRHTKRQEETQSETESNHQSQTQVMELKVGALKITMIKMLKALMEKKDNMQDQVGNFTGEKTQM
jgi:hypothetical protein